MNDTKESPNNGTFDALIKDAQLVITVAYLAAVGIGMIFSYRKYYEFGINIFDYADVFDFLIAPFADFILILFTLFSFVVAFLIYRSDLYWQQKFPQTYGKFSFGMNTRSWYSTYRYLSAFSVFAFYLFMCARVYGHIQFRKIKAGNEVSLTYADNAVAKGILIGKTKDVLFLLDNNKVSVIPIEALKKLDI